MSDQDPAALLTEQQVECLRLVYLRKEVKEIARARGIAPSTVEYHLKNARRILGAGTSTQAAIRLFGPPPDPSDPYGRTIVGPTVVSEPPDRLTSPMSDQPLGAHLAEDRVPFISAPVPTATGIEWPVPTRGRRTNEMTVWMKALWLFLLSILLPLPILIPAALFALLNR